MLLIDDNLHMCNSFKTRSLSVTWVPPCGSPYHSAETDNHWLESDLNRPKCLNLFSWDATLQSRATWKPGFQMPHSNYDVESRKLHHSIKVSANYKKKRNNRKDKVTSGDWQEAFKLMRIIVWPQYSLYTVCVNDEAFRHCGKPWLDCYLSAQLCYLSM